MTYDYGYGMSEHQVRQALEIAERALEYIVETAGQANPERLVTIAEDALTQISVIV